MADEIKKVYSENPLIDEIIYECQQMIQGIVLKDELSANNAETKKSLHDADLYTDIVNGTVTYGRLEYTYDVFMKVPSMTPALAVSYANGIIPVPDGIKPLLMKFASEKWLNKYEDSNNYYRTLWGRPKYGEDGIYLTSDQMEKLPAESYDNSHMVHESTQNEAHLLYTYGIIDELKETYPNAKYLDHLGEKSITPAFARSMPKFSVLYLPAVSSTEVSNKFRDRLEVNRVFVLKTIYSEAYAYQSDYYDRFMMIMVILLSLNDMVVYSPEYIISRDLFDFRTIEYIFDACGVDFFPEIPLQYQKRLVKNLNRLIKYKSSNKCLVDIASLFGFNNIELFKYYIMKIPTYDDDGNYKKDTYTDPTTGKEVLNLESNYDLKFLKVPIDGIADDYLNDPLAYEDYDSTVYNDIYWNGVYTQEYVKHKILEHEFNINISKYISLDTVYSLTELQFEMVYFINMLLYSKVDTSDVRVEVPELSMSKTYPLVELLLLLYTMMYMYNGVNDTIVYDPVRALDVCGFNFETDIAELKTYVVAQGYTLEEVGLDKFQNPNPVGIHDWDTLLDTYHANKEVCNKLIKLMNNANDYAEYSLYRKVYQALFVTKLQFDIFTDASPNKKAPTRYTEYLKWANTELYNLVVECSNIATDTDRQSEISRIINYVTEAIYGYLDKDEFRYVFQNIPTVNLDYIRTYLFKVLNFFKSYMVDIVHTNIIYRFDDQLENRVRIIDQIIFHYIFTKGDVVKMDDAFKMALIKLNPHDIVPIVDQIRFEVSYWIKMHFKDQVIYWDRWRDFLVTMTKTDYADPYDETLAWTHVYNWSEYCNPSELYSYLVNRSFKDGLSVNDYIDITRTYN